LAAENTKGELSIFMRDPKKKKEACLLGVCLKGKARYRRSVNFSPEREKRRGGGGPYSY